MMHLKFKRSYLSIKHFEKAQLPDFTVLVGRNGVGKTHLLEAIKKGCVTVQDLSSRGIELYSLDSFKPQDSGEATWGICSFPERVAEQYFYKSSGPSPVEIAKSIFEQIVEEFDFPEGSDQRRQFEVKLLNSRGSLNTGSSSSKADIPRLKYINRIQNEVFHPLQSGNDSYSMELVTLAIQLTRKLPHEIRRDDVLRAANYKGDTIANDLSQMFTRYKVEQYSWAHMGGETGTGTFQELILQYRRKHTPPWVTFREELQKLREAADEPELFNFEFSDPEEEAIDFASHQQYSFKTILTNRATGESYSTKNLSSGEKVLMALCMASFNESIGRRQPKLVLIDEVDAVLHPSMISALIVGLKSLFVEKGVKVILATHSVTTVAIAEEGEIFQLVRRDNKVNIRSTMKSKAISELSEGIATIDVGLEIALSEATPVTILTEGNNVLHLKKWASIFYPNKVTVFENLLDKTSSSQLKTYGQFLARVRTNSHFLIVWDCDAASTAKELEQETRNASNVTAFSFTKHDNQIAAKGIENKYEEKVLMPFANSVFSNATGEEVCQSFDSSKKKEFAEFVVSQGNEEHFQNFDDLNQVVKSILAHLS